MGCTQKLPALNSFQIRKSQGTLNSFYAGKYAPKNNHQKV
jgi:hypothetical protein